MAINYTSAGQMRHRANILKAERTPDGAGGYTEEYRVVATAWAMLSPLQGRELFQANQVDSRQNTRIHIRYRPNVTPQMYVQWGEHWYLIRSVIDIEQRHRELVLMCEELQVTTS